MAVTRDSQGTSKGGAGVSSFTFTTLTIGGSANALVVGIGFQFQAASVGTITITWAGTPMTLLGTVDIPTAGSVFLYGLLNPTTGAQTLSVSWTAGAQAYAVQCVSYNGVDSFAHFNSNSGTSTSASVAITSATGNMVVDCAASVAQSISAPTQTVVGSTFSGNITGFGMSDASGAATVNFGWTVGASANWADVGAELAVPSAPSATLMGAICL